MENIPDKSTFVNMAHAQNYLCILENLQYTDPFKGIQEESICLEDIPRL